MTRRRKPDRDDEQLRALFADAVDDIEPADRLAAITARTRAEEKGSMMRNKGLAIGGAVVGTAAIITAAAWAGGAFDMSPDEPGPAASDTASPPPEPSDPASSAVDPSPSSSPSPEQTDGASPTPDGSGEQKAAGIYFVGDGPDGVRLYREFQQVAGPDPLEALNVSLQGRAQDPDYRTAWAGVVDRIEHWSFQGNGAQGFHQIVFPADAGNLSERPAGMSDREARIAVQQLVRTVQAFNGTPAGVNFHVDEGQTLDTLLGVPANGDAPGEFVAAPGLEVLNHVSITNPAEGATVGDGTLEANGRASSFEANVPWEIRQDGTVVKDGATTADGWMNRLHPWSTTIDVSDLDPGTYTFVAQTSDPSGGAEGSGPHTDTRTFTVR